MNALATLRRRLRPRTRLRNALAPLLGLPEQPPPDATTGLHDAVLSGWFNQQTGELWPGFPIGPDDVVADIGCGLGGHAGFCAQQGAKLILVDADAIRLSKAAERVENIPNHRAFESYVSYCNPIPLADATASRIICSEVLEHVEDPGGLLAELVRIGRPGALYLITCPAPESEALQKRVAEPRYFLAPNHVRVIEPAQLTGWVEGAGLEVLSQDKYGFFWSLWLALYWSGDTALPEPGTNIFEDQGHPVLDHWLRTWKALLEQPYGAKVKSALDDLLPKSQLVIAQKGGPIKD